jgi:hypothetical protein
VDIVATPATWQRRIRRTRWKKIRQNVPRSVTLRKKPTPLKNY